MITSRIVCLSKAQEVILATQVVQNACGEETVNDSLVSANVTIYVSHLVPTGKDDGVDGIHHTDHAGVVILALHWKRVHLHRTGLN